MEWQLIETAPKDGTEILMFGPGVLFKNGRSSIYAKARHIGWWTELEISEDSFWATRDPEVSCRPTHWMPLPPPPNP